MPRPGQLPLRVCDRDDPSAFCRAAGDVASSLPVVPFVTVARATFLLRGVNVGGHRRVPMAELRAAAASVGLADPRTYLASGNLVAGCDGDVGRAAARLAHALAERFGFAVDVVARDAVAWARYAADAPFPDVDAPNRVLLYLPRDPAPAGALEALAARLVPGERAVATADGIWVFHADGAGRSKLTPAAIDAAFGSPTTGRNARTVAAIAQLLGILGIDAPDAVA